MIENIEVTLVGWDTEVQNLDPVGGSQLLLYALLGGLARVCGLQIYYDCQGDKNRDKYCKS